MNAFATENVLLDLISKSKISRTNLIFNCIHWLCRVLTRSGGTRGRRGIDSSNIHRAHHLGREAPLFHKSNAEVALRRKHPFAQRRESAGRAYCKVALDVHLNRRIPIVWAILVQT